MKTKPLTIAFLLCASILSVSVFDRGQVVAQSKKSTSVRRQQELVKRIDRRAELFYRKFIAQSLRIEAALNSELNEHLEDLVLVIDSISDPRYLRHNLIIVMRIASDIERLLLLADISSELILAWTLLHADLDLLAKINNIKWNEAVITNELIADTEFTSLKYIICPIHDR